MTFAMTFAIVCLNEACALNLTAINMVNIAEENVESFYDEYEASEGDHCPGCGHVGVAIDVSDAIDNINEWTNEWAKRTS